MSEPEGTSSGPRPHAALQLPGLVGLGLVAAATLGFEVFLTRLLAYTVPTLLIYMVLGVAMTGFGAASSVIALRPAVADVPREMSRWASAFSILLVVACALFVRVAPMLASAPLLSFAAALLLTVPFFAAGTVITLALTSAGGRVRRVYAVDLLGSGLGCLLPFLFLRALGGTGFIGLTALLAALGALLLAKDGARASSTERLGLPALGALAAVLTVGLGNTLLPITPEPSGQVSSSATRQRLVTSWFARSIVGTSRAGSSTSNFTMSRAGPSRIRSRSMHKTTPPARCSQRGTGATSR